VSSLLGLLGLISGFLAAVNQLLKLWQWRSEDSQKDESKDLADDLEVIEARLDAIDEELERLEAEKDCQE
jgi:hypothetical protein